MGWHQTIIIGNVGKEPELRYTPNNVPVCTFSVAVTERWNDKQSNEKKEKTTWYRVTCWRGLAETANQYVKKGMQIMVTGTVEVRAYTNNAGEAAASLELNAANFQFLGGKSNSSGEQRQEQAPVISSDDDFANNLYAGDVPF